MNDHVESQDDDEPVDESSGNMPFAKPAFQSEQISESHQFQYDELLLLRYGRKTAIVDVILVLMLMFAIEELIRFGVNWLISLPFHSTNMAVLPIEMFKSHADQVSSLITFPAMVVFYILICVFIWLIIRRRGQSYSSIGLDRRGLGLNCLIGIAGLLVCFAFSIFTWGFAIVFWRDSLAQIDENIVYRVTSVPTIQPLGLLGYAMIVGIVEETLFRGFLMTRLHRALGGWIWSVLISTGIFALLHMHNQVIPILVDTMFCSVVLSFLTIWRRSIVPAIVLHSLWNWFVYFNVLGYMQKE